MRVSFVNALFAALLIRINSVLLGLLAQVDLLDVGLDAGVARRKGSVPRS